MFGKRRAQREERKRVLTQARERYERNRAKNQELLNSMEQQRREDNEERSRPLEARIAEARAEATSEGSDVESLKATLRKRNQALAQLWDVYERNERDLKQAQKRVAELEAELARRR